MRTIKKALLSAALLLSFSAAGAVFGTAADAASLEAKAPAGPVSNAGRDYRIALINAERSSGPVIHKPILKNAPEAENDMSRHPDKDTFPENKGGDDDRNQPAHEPSHMRNDHRGGPEREIRPGDGQPDFHANRNEEGGNHHFDEHRPPRPDGNRGPRYGRDGKDNGPHFDRDHHPHQSREGEQRFHERRHPRLDRDGKDNGRFDNDHNSRDDRNGDHRFDRHRPPRPDGNFGPRGDKDGSHRFDRHPGHGGNEQPPMPPEDAQF